MGAPVITSGDDIALPVYLYDGGTLIIATGTTIVAAIQDSRGNQLIADTTQSSSTSGADWPNGLIMVAFPASATGDLIRGNAWLELQQTKADGTKRTWPLIALDVQAGTIS